MTYDSVWVWGNDLLSTLLKQLGMRSCDGGSTRKTRFTRLNRVRYAQSGCAQNSELCCTLTSAFFLFIFDFLARNQQMKCILQTGERFRERVCCHYEPAKNGITSVSRSMVQRLMSFPSFSPCSERHALMPEFAKLYLHASSPIDPFHSLRSLRKATKEKK